MARKKKDEAQKAGTWLRLWFHPQRGAVVLEVERELNPTCLRYRGGQDSAWAEVSRFVADRAPDGTWTPRPGQRLPAGFLWGDPQCQNFGMGGPQLAFGPLERTCRNCGDAFVFLAQEQKHWLETLGFHIDSTAVRCLPCRSALRKVEQGRQRWEAALHAAQTGKGPAAQLALARAGLALLRTGTGARVVLEKATAACRRAQRLGAADADAVLEELRALRAHVGRR